MNMFLECSKMTFLGAQANTATTAAVASTAFATKKQLKVETQINAFSSIKATRVL